MAAAGNRGAVTPQGQARTAITNVTQMSNWQSAERTTPNGQARTGRTRRVAEIINFVNQSIFILTHIYKPTDCPPYTDTLAD